MQYYLRNALADHTANLNFENETFFRIKCDGQHKLEELSRRFGVLEEDLRRSTERADHADQKVTVFYKIKTAFNVLFDP
jgi:nickel-dependent lactate racemase